MTKDNPILKSLIDHQDSCLVLIDVQKIFLDKLDQDEVEPLVKRMIWLVKVANKLSIPLVVTAEDTDRNGSIIPELAETLPAGTQIHNKMIFGLASDPDILSSVRNTKRETIILLGLETDVCVAQSAIGLLENGFKVGVVQDATASPGDAHQYGINRIKSAGILITNTKSLFYQWMRSVESCESFIGTHEDYIGDPGIKL